MSQEISFAPAEELGELPRLPPRIPWIPVALALLFLLWIPLALRPGDEPTRPAEAAWVPSIAELQQGPLYSAPLSFSERLTRASVTLETSMRGLSPTELGPDHESLLRAAARRPSAIAAFLLLFIYFVLGRRMIGDAAALVAAALLAVTGPFLEAARSAHPILIAETFALAGVAWMVGIESRHREVGYTLLSALEASAAGLLFGFSLVEHPATAATVLAALFLWLSLGLRRNRATTLPTNRPGSSSAYAIFGCIGLLLTTGLTVAILEHLGGAPARGFLATLAGTGPESLDFPEIYRWIVSSVPGTDVLVIGAVAVVVTIAIIEKFRGTHWRGAGLLPWVYLLLFVLIVSGVEFAAAPTIDAGVTPAEAASFPLARRLPLSISPLFVLGLGWLALRGFSPGRVRRQEYTFLLVWLAASVFFLSKASSIDRTISGSTLTESLSHAGLTVLPMVALVSARAARAFWESDRALLARFAILAFACLPVVSSLLSSIFRFLVFPSVPERLVLETSLPTAMGGCAALGALSVLVTVRPDAPTRPTRRPTPPGRPDRPHRRRGHGRGRPGRGRDRRPPNAARSSR